MFMFWVKDKTKRGGGDSLDEAGTTGATPSEEPPLHSSLLPCSFRCIPATLRLAGKCRLRVVT